MSETPRDDFELSFYAASELQEQQKKATKIVEALAISLAAADSGRDPDERVFVEAKHVLEALQKLQEYASCEEVSATRADVFISYSSKDTKFGSQLASQLQDEQVTCFLADQTIPPGAEWTKKIWSALRQCRVVVFVITSQFTESDWCRYEIGAALALNKRIVPALRVGGIEPPAVLQHIQSMEVQTREQEDELVRKLREVCRE